MRVIICAAGDGSRWGEYLGRRKHFARVNGEPIIERTIRLLRAAGVDDIFVTARPQDLAAYGALDAAVVEKPAGLTNNDARAATQDLWHPTDRTVILWGDTYFTANSLATIIDDRSTGWTLYARLRASEVTGKPGPEIFGVSFGPADQRVYADALARHSQARWSSWVIYLDLTGQPLDLAPSAIQNKGRCVEISDDGTDDFDFPDDYERYHYHQRRSSRRVIEMDFYQNWFRDRMRELGLHPKLHRKPWEFCSIAQAYHDRYGHGGRVLGFGVGKEPLPAWLAKRGAAVVATDRPDAGVWLERQHAKGFDDLRVDGVCDRETFERQVVYQPVDMNAIPSSLHGLFDMTWSASCFEHLGSISRGIDFFVEQMKCLKPGGIAVHTTEWNVSDPSRTVDSHNLCFFRSKDLEQIRVRLEAQGDRLWPVDGRPGTLPADLIINDPPFENQEQHLLLRLGGVVFTSVLLIAVRQGGGGR